MIVDTIDTCINCVFLAVHKVAECHRMVSEGWTLFECTCEEVGPGELPQLLRQLKGSITPLLVPAISSTPTSQVIPKAEPMEEQASTFQQPSPVAGASAVVPVVGSSGFIEMVIMIKLGPHSYEFRCGNCNIPPRATRHAMDAHIRGTPTKKALLCSFCHFSTYNLDSLQRHEKEHK